VTGSGISCSVPRSRQITTPASHRSVFYRPDALPAPNQQRQSTEGSSTVCLVICHQLAAACHDYSLHVFELPGINRSKDGMGSLFIKWSRDPHYAVFLGYLSVLE